MRIYVYKCDDCGRIHEARQPVTGDPLARCPYCGSERFRRRIGKVHVILRGDGWTTVRR